MFSSNPLDKSCIGPDCSSGRSNASNRFPVGITSLGDENQQIRIQLAVHKYNSSANGPLNSRCGVISPYRHSFLNNSLKAKGYEGEGEGTSKSEKRNGNQYEGVGAFPTIHLRKSAVRYRPIRRFHDVKVSYPELPVNRFLSNLPEACPDVKSSTRSVLDVLEDLSGKKIHSKEENGSNKPKSKGLGGDYVLNQNAVYKPLFVQKPKISTVLTRDNTTQTLSALSAETQSPQSSNTFIRNDTPDPRAELRRKLAKQNNEIFASLSSSISSSFCLKRKIDKVTPAGHDESVTDGSAKKNPRLEHQNSSTYNGNGISKSASRSKTSYVNDPAKLNRRNQLKETNSPTSPNKDRLTTIFLDMQNTSPKAQIFQNSTPPPAGKPAEVTTQITTGFTNGFSTNTSNTHVKSSNGTSTVDDDKDKNGLKNLTNVEKTEVVDLKKTETEQGNKPTFNFPINQVNTTVTKSTAVSFQFGGSSTASNLGVPKASTESSSGDAPKKTENDSSSSSEKKPEDNPISSKPFTFGSSNDKPNFSSFKFGATDAGNNPTAPSSSGKESKPVEPVGPANSANPTSPQFSFGTVSNPTVSTSQTFSVSFGVPSAQNTVTPPSKSLFTFGQNTSQPIPGNTKPEVSSPSSTSVPATSVQASSFKFGEKLESPVKTAPGETSLSQPITFSASASNPGAVVQNNKPVFSFGQKTEPTATSATSVTTGQDPKFTFAFGQKPDAEANKVQETAKNANLFSFGQKSIPQESQSAGVPAVAVSQPATTQTTSVFGQNVSQTSPPQMKFGQMTTPTNNFGAKTETSTLGNNVSSSTFSPGGSSFPIKTSLFGSSGNGFGATTTQVSSGLGTSTSSAPTFSFGATATTQSTGTFGVSSASQVTAPTFGAPTTQSTSGFGSSSTTQATPAFGTSVSASTFGGSTTTQTTSAFPVSSTTQAGSSFGGTSTTQSLSAFRAPSISQSTPSFGIPSTTQSSSTFGVSSTPQSTPSFGTSSTTQTTPAFAPSSGFGVPTSSQPSTVFGAPNSTQSPVRFGAPMAPSNTGFGATTGFSSTPSTQASSITFGSPATSSSAFGTSQSSFSQPFNNKPATSLGQSTNIFGQSPAPSFSSGTTFNANQSNVFGQKPNSEGDMFEQNKIQTSAGGFGATSQAFGNQSKFGFGMSTSNATGFTNSPPNTTSAVFSFGGSTTANTFTFGGGTGAGGSTMTSNTQAPFAFKSPTSEPFKFVAAVAKEGTGFGGSPANFNFGGQMNNNNNAMAEQKPAFSFGSPQVSSSAPFAFGTPSPSVFSFGGSTAGSSGSSFNFGTPTPGGPFGQPPSASPGAPFPVPGTFSIGSGSSQSRPRATSRPRRRP